MTTPARKPRPADVARWVAVLVRPEPSTEPERAAWCRDGIEARERLYDMGLDTRGEDMSPAADEPTQASSDALAASLWTVGEVVGDPWALAQGVPVGRGAAPLSGPCCGEEGL